MRLYSKYNDGVKTYGEILDSRTTLERIIDKADVDYNWKQLSGMMGGKGRRGFKLPFGF